MKKQYTKKQIMEAVARWERTLRRMDEDGAAEFDASRPEQALALVEKVSGTTPQSLFEMATYLYSTGADELVKVQRNGTCTLLTAAADDKGVYFQVKSLRAPDLLSLADLLDNVRRVAAKNGVSLDPSPRRWNVVSNRIQGAAGEKFVGWSLDGNTGDLCLYMDGDAMPQGFGDITADAKEWAKDLNRALDKKAGYKRG